MHDLIYPQSKILIVEVISIPSTIATTNNFDSNTTSLDDLRAVKEYRPITPPKYIPANFGANAKMSQALGIHMWGVFNAKERYFVSLLPHTDISNQTSMLIVCSYFAERMARYHCQSRVAHFPGLRSPCERISD